MRLCNSKVRNNSMFVGAFVIFGSYSEKLRSFFHATGTARLCLVFFYSSVFLNLFSGPTNLR